MSLIDRNTKVTVGVGILALIALGYWLANRGPTKTPAGELRIAANVPMSGPLAYYGAAIREGATMALEPKASPASPLTGVSIDWQDNASEPKTTVSILQKQILDNPTIYVSGVKPQVMAIKDGDQAGFASFCLYV